MLFEAVIIECLELIEGEGTQSQRQLTLDIKRARQATRMAHGYKGKDAKTKAALDAHGLAAERWHGLRKHKLIGRAAEKLRDHHQKISRGGESDIPVKGLTYSQASL